MLKERLQQRLLQKLSPQQIQLMKLLQIPTVSLEQRIKEELELNPALEEGKEEEEEEKTFEDDLETESIDEASAADSRDDFDFDQYFDDDETPGYKLSAKNTGPDDERKEIPFSGGTSFQDFLHAQLGLRVLDEQQFAIAENILGNIDDDGYLRREIESLVNDLAFSQNIITTEEEVENLLKVIQEFDPPGVGARNLQECLMLQLQRKDQHQCAFDRRGRNQDHIEPGKRRLTQRRLQERLADTHGHRRRQNAVGRLVATHHPHDAEDHRQNRLPG
jgi:RNA polymerase sigma-54 factor